ncbi:hypothetical protein ETAA8_55840 [Anatilimnocola aggregata]|uniref:DUF2459 domain-containing protein n=1 Tax=Anatilimnocola aggregata TaxID=2528021 RepID=A0A517YJN7_9BACT|nr:TIGR02117 family protein [Anatilimnocola aggregata]QDU30444.1 hypothetical protein ETAA8_55840 [Anatilimnocola aggregata]
MNDVTPTSQFASIRNWTFRWLGRCLAAFAGVYAGFLLLGCVPVNHNYQIPAADNCVVIFVRSNEIHADLVLPVTNQHTSQNWHDRFPPEHFQHRNVAGDEYVAVGWGNRAFFVETPTWEDFKLTTALRGLFTPSESVLHVEYVPLAETREYHEVRITPSQYAIMCQHIEETIGNRDEHGHAVPATPKTFGDSDRFYNSTGTYHLFSTCNQWVGRGLKRAGVPTGLWTPLQQHVLFWLPKRSAAETLHHSGSNLP